MANVHILAVHMTVRPLQQCTLVVRLTLERTLVVWTMLAHMPICLAGIFDIPPA